MTDERFTHDLQQVLREAAGEEAPMSLRSRLSSIIDEAPVSRRLWFSPPMRLSVAVVSAVAVLALALLLMPRDNVGPGPSASPTPSTEQSTTTEPSAEPTPTVEPTPSAEPTQTITPWASLAWRSLAPPNDAHSFASIGDVVASETGYVAVGAVYHESGAVDLAFFLGGDSGWTITQQAAGVATNQAALTEQVVRTSDGFIAVVAPHDAPDAVTLWFSADGSAWSAMGDGSWSAAWANAEFLGIAAGPRGIVAIGDDRSTGQAVVLASADGQAWEQASLPVGETVAVPRDVAAFAAGFVIVGREGQPDTTATDTGLVTPGVGRPAAWTSTDGIDWSSAEVEGNVAAGIELRRVFVGTDGLLATGVNTETAPATIGELSTLGATAWTSSDGSTWQLSDQLRSQVADARLIASDGARMVAFGVDESTADEFNQADSAAWVSTDGETWARLRDANGEAPRFYTRDALGQCAGCPVPGGLWVVTDGILVSIQAGAPAQGMLFGAADLP